MVIYGSPPLIYKIAVGHLNLMACIHIKPYSKFKDFIHPNVDWNIDHYRKGYHYTLPGYHGCSLKNKNGIRKRIDYKRGYQCILPTKKTYWKKNKCKQFYFYSTIYQTRYQPAFALAKGHYWYNYKTKKYEHKKEISKRIGF